jgi:glutathione S-transferase
MRKQLHGHGMGRHREADIYAIGQRDITALADFLGDKPYFLGETPCSLDATAYAFLANLLWVPVESPLKQHARQYPQLEAYCQRMRSRYYP